MSAYVLTSGAYAALVNEAGDVTAYVWSGYVGVTPVGLYEEVLDLPGKDMSPEIH